MKLWINGEQREFSNLRTLPDLIEALGLPAASLLVEHNGTALHRSEWCERTIKEGDQFEFLRVAAGG